MRYRINISESMISVAKMRNNSTKQISLLDLLWIIYMTLFMPS